MIKVVVGPYDRFDVRATYVQTAGIRVEDRCDVRSWRDHRRCLYERDDFRGVIFPVFANTEVEYDVVAVVGD